MIGRGCLNIILCDISIIHVLLVLGCASLLLPPVCVIGYVALLVIASVSPTALHEPPSSWSSEHSRALGGTIDMASWVPVLADETVLWQL